MSKKPKVTQRAPTNTLIWLLELIRRIDPAGRAPDQLPPVSWSDRKDAAMLLTMIARDEDVRDRFYCTVPHRPREQDNGTRYAAAFVYLARIALKQAKPGKVLRGEIAKLSGLTDAQVGHAVRDQSYNVGKMVDLIENPEMLAGWMQMYVSRLHELRRQK
jgi:hypothetical protein